MPKYVIDEAADPTPLEVFYARNPEELSDDDLAKLVELHRAEREARALKATKRSKKNAG